MSICSQRPVVLAILVVILFTCSAGAVEHAEGNATKELAFHLTQCAFTEATVTSSSDEHWYSIHKTKGRLYLNYIAANSVGTELRIDVFDGSENTLFGDVFGSTQASGRSLPIDLNAIGDFLVRVTVFHWDAKMDYTIEMHSLTGWDFNTEEIEPNNNSAQASVVGLPGAQLWGSRMYTHTIFGQFSHEQDGDWFALPFAPNGAEVTVTLWCFEDRPGVHVSLCNAQGVSICTGSLQTVGRTSVSCTLPFGSSYVCLAPLSGAEWRGGYYLFVASVTFKR